MSELLYRRNSVREALRGRRHVYRLYVQSKGDRKILSPLVALAKKRRIPIEYVDKQRLANLVQDGGHQGVVLEVGAYPYSDSEAMLALARERGEPPFLLVLDLVQGVQNVGTLLRTAEACGVHGVIMQERRAPEITPSIVMNATGATEHLHIAKVTNLTAELQRLQDKHGIWVVGLAMDETAQALGQVDLAMPLALVVGHEGAGLRNRVQKQCDLILRLPMRGEVESLNASVAGSIALYAAWQARGFPGA